MVLGEGSVWDSSAIRFLTRDAVEGEMARYAGLKSWRIVSHEGFTWSPIVQKTALQFAGLFVCSCWDFVLPIKQERNIEVKKYEHICKWKDHDNG